MDKITKHLATDIEAVYLYKDLGINIYEYNKKFDFFLKQLWVIFYKQLREKFTSTLI